MAHVAEAQPAALVAGSGILVDVRSPARFALGKRKSFARPARAGLEALRKRQPALADLLP